VPRRMQFGHDEETLGRGPFDKGVSSEVVGVSGAPTVQNDVDCARAALALVSDSVAGGTNS
jgi:hypothetical protein